MRGLSDEPSPRGGLGEEFSSEPVFNQQIHQVGDAPGSFATLAVQSRSVFASLEKNTLIMDAH